MSRKKSIKQFKQEVYNLVKEDYEVLGNYVNTHTKILMKHNICGYEYEVRPIDFLKNNGNRCPKCSGNIKNKTTDYFKQEIYNLVGTKYEVLGEYVNNRTKILIKHKTCGHKYEVTPNDFQQGKRCPYCQRSKGEEIIASILDDLDYKYETQVSFSDCKYKRPLKSDFQIFLDDGTFILLEYNGIQHYERAGFQSQKSFEDQQIRDQIKEKYCKDNFIPLYIIRYDEDIEYYIKRILN